MNNNEVTVTVSGPPGSGKSTICCAIYDALKSSCLEVSCEDTNYDLYGEEFRRNLGGLIHKNTNIVIKSEQTKRTE